MSKPRWSKLNTTLKKNAERASRAGTRFFKFPPGKTIFRILPAAPGDDEENWFLYVGNHYGVDPERKSPVICRAVTNYAEEECPVCDVVAEMRQSGQNDEAGKISVRRRYLIRALVRGQEDRGPQVMDLPITVFTQMGEAIQDEDTFGDILSLKNGRDFIITKSGSGKDTTYVVNAHPKQTRIMRTQQDAMNVINTLTPIEDLVAIPELEEVAKLVHEDVEDEEEGFGAQTTSVADVADDDGGDWEEDDSDEKDEVASEAPFDADDEEEGEEAPADLEDEEEEGWMDDDGEDLADPKDTVGADEDEQIGDVVTRVRGKIKSKVSGKAKTTKPKSRRRKSA